MRLALIDYHKGNITSVKRALDNAGTDVLVTDDASCVERSDAIVLPGVGAFTDAMATLNDLGLSGTIKNQVDRGVPFLGICLGMHLMFEGGCEHAPKGEVTKGIGIIDGIVEKMPDKDAHGSLFKIPHVGWNSIEAPRGAIKSHISKTGEDGGEWCSSLIQGIEESEYFYFTHSYISPKSEFTIAETTHSVTFPSIVGKGNAFGVQFHPEKSSIAGQRLIANFVELAEGAIR